MKVGSIVLLKQAGKLMSVEYKLLGYKPEEVQHKFIIKGGKRGGDTVEAKN